MGNSNYLKLVVPNMHKFSQFFMFCKLHGVLDKINKEKYKKRKKKRNIAYRTFHETSFFTVHAIVKRLPCYIIGWFSIIS